MAASEGQARYILTLVVEGGWPDESLVPRPDDMQRELRATFDRPITIQASKQLLRSGGLFGLTFDLVDR
jgi:hypothetical protein